MVQLHLCRNSDARCATGEKETEHTCVCAAERVASRLEHPSVTMSPPPAPDPPATEKAWECLRATVYFSFTAPYAGGGSVQPVPIPKAHFPGKWDLPTHIWRTIGPVARVRNEETGYGTRGPSRLPKGSELPKGAIPRDGGVSNTASAQLPLPAQADMCRDRADHSICPPHLPTSLGMAVLRIVPRCCSTSDTPRPRPESEPESKPA